MSCVNLKEEISVVGDGKINEDICGYANNRFWVLDGATPKTKKHYFSVNSDAQYLVRKFSDELKKCCFEQPKLSNRQLLAYAMGNVRSQIPNVVIPKEELLFRPSFAAAIVYIKENSVGIDLLSDCYVIVKCDGEVCVYTDSRINVIIGLTQEIKKYVALNDIEKITAEKIINQRKIDNRRLMNTDGGYWVGTIDGNAFDNTISFEIKRTPNMEIIICSDGFYKMIQYGLIDINQIFTTEESFDLLIRKLRLYEKKHIEYGSKISDDATAIRLSI